MMFSVHNAVGAMSAPLAVDRIADSSAPKNRTWAHIGVCSRISAGEWCAHRSDRVMHGKHHQAVLPADDGPAIPSYAAHRAGGFFARRAAVCAELQEHDV